MTTTVRQSRRAERLIALADTVRPQAARAIEALRRVGVPRSLNESGRASQRQGARLPAPATLHPWRTALAVMSLTLSLAAGVAEAQHPARIAPELALTDIDGRPLRLAGFRGRVVVVSFWATWANGGTTLDALGRLQERFGRELDIVAICVEPHSPEWARRLMDVRRRAHTSYAFDVGSGAAQSWQPPVVPATYVIDRAGEIRYLERGYLFPDRLEALASEVARAMTH